MQIIDVGDKQATRRRAIATGRVHCNRQFLDAIIQRRVPKGNVIEAAQLAGLQAAKQTSSWLPFCHPLPLDHVRMQIDIAIDHIAVRAEVCTTWKTGVEMEALTAVAAAALTVVDMGKSFDREMSIVEIHLEEKTGGRSGDYQRTPAARQP